MLKNDYIRSNIHTYFEFKKKYPDEISEWIKIIAMNSSWVKLVDKERDPMQDL